MTVISENQRRSSVTDINPLTVIQPAHDDVFSYVGEMPPFSPADQEGSLTDPEARAKAFELMVQGIPVAFQMQEVFGFMADSKNSAAIKRSLLAKGEVDLQRPWSTFMFASKALTYFDRTRVHPKLHWLVDNPKEADKRIGYMFHLRGALKPELVDTLPPAAYSYNEEYQTYYLQFFSPFGHSPISIFIREAAEYFPGRPLAITTFNQHSLMPEITNLKDAREFFGELGGKVQFLLTDPTCKLNGIEDPADEDYLARGSFLVVDAETLEVTRDGVVPVEVAEKILGTPLKRTNIKAANFTPPNYPVKIFDLDHTEAVRAAVRQIMKGRPETEIFRRVDRINWDGNGSTTGDQT